MNQTDQTHDMTAGTRERALAAAERLFVGHGYEGASMRAIAAEARVNLGSLVYHFASKELLFRALCEDRVGPILARQASALAACSQRIDRGEGETLEGVIRALIAPAADGIRPQQPLQGLYGLIFTDPSEMVLKVGLDLFGEVTRLLHRLVRRFLPELPAEEFFWRYVCAVGGFVVAQAFARRMAILMDAEPPAADGHAVVETLVFTILRAFGSPATLQPATS